MPACRPVAWLLIALLLFMRLAVSAHACSAGTDNTDMNPALCHAHCVDPQSAASGDAPLLPPQHEPHLLAVLPTPLAPALPGKALDFRLRRTDPPPLLAYCVMRS